MHEVRVRLVLAGMRLEYRGTRAFYERAIEPLVATTVADARAAAPAQGPGSPVPPAPPQQPALAVFKPSSPPQFSRYVAQVGPNAADLEQRLMAFAFYLWNFERRDEFDEDDIASFFRTFQESPPDDLGARLLDLGERLRFLEAGSAPGSWRLSTKGVNYVKIRLLAAE